jgi:hypothetical protein
MIDCNHSREQTVVTMDRLVNEEEWKEWLANPLTQAYRTMLVMMREGMKEQLAGGDRTELLDLHRGIAQAQLLEDLIDFNYEDYQRAMGVHIDETVPKTESE